MSNIHLLNALKKELKVSNDAQLAKRLNVTHSHITHLNTDPTKPLSDRMIVRCYDYAGFSINKTRELHRKV